MKLIITKELGRLTRWLRLLGLDAVYFDSEDMDGLFVKAFNESRILITKRVRVSKIKALKVIYVKSDTLKGQVAELRKKIGLKIHRESFFTRCADCNREVFTVKKDSVKGMVPEYVFKTQKIFFQCPECAKIFWKATHWDRAKEFLSEVCS